MNKLYSANAHARRCTQLNKVFLEKKCRLRLNNEIRWSNSFLVLESVKKAYERNAFSDSDLILKFPVSLYVIDSYLKILKPSFILNANMQLSNSSIMETIAEVLHLLSEWETQSKNCNSVLRVY